jgi:protein gp37
MHPDWVRSLRDQCQAAGVPFFFKQWGEWIEIDDYYYDVVLKHPEQRLGKVTSFNDNTRMGWLGKKAAGSMLDGKEYKQYPC